MSGDILGWYLSYLHCLTHSNSNVSLEGCLTRKNKINTSWLT